MNLELEGYSLAWATDLKSATHETHAQSFQLILLDLGLPDGSGFTFLRDLRKAGSMVPVIILTAKTDEDSVVEGLQSGASDYIRKPFGDRELLARIKTVLREPQTRTEQIRYGELVVRVDQRKVLHAGSEVELSPREFDILHYLVQNADNVVTRKSMLESLDREANLFDRTIDSNVSHVRARLRRSGVKSIQISSIYGVGYRLEKT